MNFSFKNLLQSFDLTIIAWLSSFSINSFSYEADFKYLYPNVERLLNNLMKTR